MTNYLRTTVLLAGLIALFMFIGQVLGGTQGMLIALVFAATLSFISYWFSDKLVLKMYRAREVDERTAPELVVMVRQLSQRARLPMPKVYIVPDVAPNAFATGRSPRLAAVAVTEGLMRLLSREELEGVIAHELAHVRNRDMLISTIAAVLASAIMFLARMAFWFGSGDDRNNIIGGLLMMILAPLAAMMVQMAISRSREYGADATGAAIAGTPLGLAQALRKMGQVSGRIPPAAAGNPATAHMMIVNHFSGRGVFRLFSTHPPIEKRVMRLQAMRSLGNL